MKRASESVRQVVLTGLQSQGKRLGEETKDQYGLQHDYRPYRCSVCGNIEYIQTNHTGPISRYRCSECSWKGAAFGDGISAERRFEYGGTEDTPAGYVALRDRERGVSEGVPATDSQESKRPRSRKLRERIAFGANIGELQAQWEAKVREYGLPVDSFVQTSDLEYVANFSSSCPIQGTVEIMADRSKYAFDIDPYVTQWHITLRKPDHSLYIIRYHVETTAVAVTLQALIEDEIRFAEHPESYYVDESNRRWRKKGQRSI